MTAPLTPHDCDLRDFPSMLLDVARLRASALAANETPEACWAAVLLWAASWHEVPAASMPDDEKWIATAAGYAIRGKIDRAWPKVRDGALRKFVKCDDGRLYHPVVAEKALECWLSKLAARLSSGAGNAKRHKIEFDPKPIEAQMAEARALLSALNPHSRALTRRKPSAAPAGTPEGSGQHPGGTPDGNPPGSQEKDKGREGSSSEAKASGGAGAPPAVDNPENPNRQAWRECGRWLVDNEVAETTARGFMGKLLQAYPETALDAMREAPKKGATPDPFGYLMATAQRMAGERKTVPSDAAEKTQREMAEQDRIWRESQTPDRRARIDEIRARMGLIPRKEEACNT